MSSRKMFENIIQLAPYPNCEQKACRAPSLFFFGLYSPCQVFLAKPHSRAMTNVCQFSVMHRKGMESML